MNSRLMNRSCISVALMAAGGLVVAMPGTAFAAGYLKLGDIKGESTDKAHKNEIEILSWSWGETRSESRSTHAGGGGGGAGKVNMARADAPARKGKVEASWKVEEGTKAAPAPGEAEITLKRGTPADAGPSAGPENPDAILVPASREAGSLTATVPAGMCREGARYETAEMGTGDQRYRMEDVLVTACAPGSSAQGDRPTESMSLNYAKISF